MGPRPGSETPPAGGSPDEGCLLQVKVVPRASRNAVLGWQADGKLAVRVTSPPEGGRANEALLRLLAEVLGLPRRSVVLVSGGASRRKTVLVRGLTEEKVRSRLASG